MKLHYKGSAYDTQYAVRRAERYFSFCPGHLETITLYYRKKAMDYFVVHVSVLDSAPECFKKEESWMRTVTQDEAEEEMRLDGTAERWW